MEYFFYGILDVEPTSFHDDEHVASFLGQVKIFSRVSGIGFNPVVVDEVLGLEAGE